MAKDDETAFSAAGSEGTPPIDPETATGPDGRPPQARQPAQPAPEPRDEARGRVAEPVPAAAGAGAEQPVQPDPTEERQAREQVKEAEKGAEAGAIPSFDVTLRLRRYDPERDDAPHWEDYRVSVDEGDRVLDALHQIRWYQDGSLAFRRSCAHGVCGSDAMVINGANRLACVLLVRDVGAEITVEPLRGLPVLKDLVVDMDAFFAQYRSVLPHLVNETDPGDGERLQSPEERARFDDTTKCILCAACTTSCPVYWANDTYVGPAAVVNAHRFIFDSRDEAADERLAILDERSGVWKCRTAFNCTDACPRGIKVTEAIQEVKRAIVRPR
jgi:succinate dehydrogenase / fumarate reductase iron-sulfur subunit